MLLRHQPALNTGGERGIRTPDTRKGIHAFEARAFSHSAISPRHCFRFILSGKLVASICRPERRLLPENALDLSNVIDVMSRKHAGDVLNRFLSALRMHPVVFPLFRLQRLEQSKVRLAEHAELLERPARVALL